MNSPLERASRNKTMPSAAAEGANKVREVKNAEVSKNDTLSTAPLPDRPKSSSMSALKVPRTESAPVQPLSFDDHRLALLRAGKINVEELALLRVNMGVLEHLAPWVGPDHLEAIAQEAMVKTPLANGLPPTLVALARDGHFTTEVMAALGDTEDFAKSLQRPKHGRQSLTDAEVARIAPSAQRRPRDIVKSAELPQFVKDAIGDGSDKAPTLYEASVGGRTVRFVSGPTQTMGGYSKVSDAVVDGDPQMYVDRSMRGLTRLRADQRRIEGKRAALFTQGKLTHEQLLNTRINMHWLEREVEPLVGINAIAELWRKAQAMPGKDPPFLADIVFAWAEEHGVKPWHVKMICDTRAYVQGLDHLIEEEKQGLAVKTYYTLSNALKAEEEMMRRVASPLQPLLTVEIDGRKHQLVPKMAGDLEQAKFLDLTHTQRRAAIRSVALQASRGLLVAHDAGIAHRDLKPENILFDVNGTVLVADWGSARMSTQQRSSTPGYGAPEQDDASAPGTEKSDVYSLGLTLRVLAGDTPQEANRAEGEFSMLHGIDRELSEFVTNCMLARNPAERCSMREVHAFVSAHIFDGSVEKALADQAFAERATNLSGETDEATNRVRTYARAFGLNLPRK